MATLMQATNSSTRTHRVSVKEYLKMIAAGVIPQDAHMELLDGILVEQMTKYPPHNFTARQVGIPLKGMLAGDWLISEEKSLRLGHFWRPEPDIAVIRGPNDRYRQNDPMAADVSLLVEVADSSYATDRAEKWRGYAASHIPVYWIVNLNKLQIEVFSAPIGRGKKARYREAATFGIDHEVPVVIDGQDVGRIAVKDILP